MSNTERSNGIAFIPYGAEDGEDIADLSIRLILVHSSLETYQN